MKHFGFNTAQIIVYVTCVGIFLAHQYFEGTNQSLEIINNYIDPLLLPILFLPIILIERRWLLDDNSHRFSAVFLLVYLILFAIISELIFPLFSEKFTADWIDVILMGVGVAIFHMVFNKNLDG